MKHKGQRYLLGHERSLLHALWLAAITICTVAGSPHGADGTTVMVMSDADLVRSSSAIVLGRVQAIATTAARLDDVETRVVLQIEEQLKGRQRRRLIFTIPGGSTQGVRRVVFGAPQFFVGERVLLFLRARRDGRLTPTALSMSKFTVADTATGVRARRQLSGVTALNVDPRTRQLVEASRPDDRPLAALLADLRALAAQEPPATTGVMPARRSTAAATRWGDAFTFMGPPPVRWVQPDTGDPVTFLVDPGGDATIGVSGSQAATSDALLAWNNAGVSVRLENGGPAIPASLNACDGQSTIQFNDPFDEIGPPSHCAGVLAVGGFCSTGDGSSTTYQRITEGDVTVNTGFAGCDFWTATNLAEILTHELGHTLGLAHSSENPQEPNPALRDATMYYLAHFDGRGAALRPDDTAGVQALYPVNSAPAQFNPIQVRRFTLNPATAELVINVLVRFPDARFTPVRDALRVSVNDSSGVLYAGNVNRFTVRPRNRGPAGYAGALTGPVGHGSALFSWLRGANGSLVLRVTGPAFATPPTTPATLSLSFGQQTFTKQVALQPAPGGEWVQQ